MFHSKSIEDTLSFFNSSKDGLNEVKILKSKKLYGENRLKKEKEKGIFSKIFEILREPMMIILLISLLVTLTSSILELIKSGSTDFIESFGIFFAIFLSTVITLFMESSSKKAFLALNKLYDNLSVVVRRDGKEIVVKKEEVVCGDILLLKTGDKIIADGRIIKAESLEIDESSLTGESNSVIKNSSVILENDAHLADRINMAYSGTFVKNGNGEMVVTAIGENAELGKISKELKKEEKETPLNVKLNSLSKKITLLGAIFSVVILVINIVKLALSNNFTFNSIQSAVVSSIILIVAAVPEGLPTIVALSLALNMIKLAKENALIKKLSAVETMGAINVICSDKTGTLTENKMTLEKVVIVNKVDGEEAIWQNAVINSSAEIVIKGKKQEVTGSGTEVALLKGYINSKGKVKELREKYKVLKVEPFDSSVKKMATDISYNGSSRSLIKGAPEVCINLIKDGKEEILKQIEGYEEKGKRVICFLHKDNDYVFDGYAVLDDKIRKEAFKAVKDCQKAGIKVVMLTGDNLLTATNIAKELNIVKKGDYLLTGDKIDNLTDKELKKVLPKLSVVARSTPLTKLKIVKAYKELGKVVAVTGDGINDAPAIKQADVGISMETGTEITKEASDVILLDNSFATIVKAVSFGRNVYENLQRFILFQLSVNLSAVLFITLSLLITGVSPFNTLELLWINIIMDGPPALTLGLEGARSSLMDKTPIKKDSSICSKKMLFKIGVNGVFISAVLLLQQTFNFLKIESANTSSALFTIFVLFQLFNAFNSRELGLESVFKSVKKNKPMLIVFFLTFIMHVVIVEFLNKPFSITPLPLIDWLKIVALTFLIIVISEIYKFILKKRINKSRRIGVN
ncbi:MAG: calcium-translocating P-type ATPase, PMCA-type [Clostridiales bacterium]|nr:calcium-translocating P-type ATPase, PMCA-type [Clostridiales bacterium]